MNADRWRRAAEVFESALDRPEPDQRSYVREACAGDAFLLREVEALLDENHRSSALDTPLGPEAFATLWPTRNIGPYRFESLLGVGGMGEVYRARDARLGRDVAIKVLPPAFAGDPDRLARFKREAQVLASLNHPNIAAIYGLESEAGIDALVLELVEGPTLADRLAAGAIPMDEALVIARQIADALAAAHDAGVVHRDLKPANVKVRGDGTVKVLDFGLAKMADAAAGRPSSPVESPTITSPAMTAAGVILGTAAYMSPEQARGKAADPRSDIWAFGCVLYEMLTGRRAFQGDDVSDTLAAILRSEPDWNAHGIVIPPAVRRVLRRCLAKDPARRYHAIADARLDLEEFTVAAPEIAAAAPPRITRERAAWAMLTAALAGGLLYFGRLAPPPAPLPAMARFELAPPEKAFFGSVGGIAGGMSGATVSPDGTRLAFVATDSAGRPSLWVRPLDGVARPLVDTDFASMPFWSPDGLSIGFFASGRIKSVDITSGSVRVIATAVSGRGASWGHDDVIVFSRGNPAALARVSGKGGAVTEIPTGAESEGVTRQPLWPHFLPDGRHFLYWSRVLADGQAGIAIASIDPGFTPRPLVRSDTAGQVMLPGILLFARGETLLQQTFDLDRLDVSGEAIPVNEQVFVNQGGGIADFAVSAAGHLVYQSGTNTLNQFAWVNRAGQQLGTVGPRGKYRSSALSPDGTRLAYENSATGDIWILDLAHQTSSRFTTAPGVEACPVWFPDGTKIAYRTDAGGVLVKEVSGTTPERRLTDMFVNGPSQITRDGKWLLFFWVPRGKPSQDVAIMPLAGEEQTLRALVESPFPDVEPQLSPDGRWLAYASPESGRNEVYVQPFPPNGDRWQISFDGGRQPMWREDGRELFFVADDRRFYGVDVNATPSRFEHGVAHFLFEMRANVFNVRNSYNPRQDGQQFLVNTFVDNGTEPLNVVLNWKPR